MNEFADDLDGVVDVAVVLTVLHNAHSQSRFAPSYSCLGLVIRTFDPYIHVYPDQPSRLVGMRRDFQRKGSACSNLSSIARKQPSAANSSRVRSALRKAVNFKTWRTASSRWRITCEASRTLITMPCTLWRRTGLAARPLLPKKSTFC